LGSERDKYGVGGFIAPITSRNIGRPMNKKQNPTSSPKKKSAWEAVKVFTHPETGISARVWRLPLKPHPLYSYEIGIVVEDDFKRFLMPKIEVVNGTAELTPLNLDAIDWVRMEADAFIIEEVQKRESELQLQAKTIRKRPETKRPTA